MAQKACKESNVDCTKENPPLTSSVGVMI
jgi:hypothetical protein